MKNKIYFLESLRGLAAIYVLIHHCRWLLTENYSYRNTKEFDLEYIATKALVFFRFGHEAVIFFFVLSGFVIHYSTLINKNNPLISYKRYLIKRINRIIPPLIFALIMTLFLDYLGKNIFALSAYSNGSKYYNLIVNNLNWKTFIANIFSMQELGLGIKHFGSNGALWSLSYEWWFYLLYPLFFTINSKNKYLALVIQVLLFVIFSILLNITIPVASAIFSKMIIWWLGVCLAEIYYRRKRLLIYIAPISLGIPLAIMFFYNDRLIGDILWGIGFIGLLSWLLKSNKNSIVIKTLDKMKGSGSFSYTLYLTHLPIVFLVHSLLLEWNRGILPNSYFYLFLVSFSCILFSKKTSPYIEKIKIFNSSKN